MTSTIIKKYVIPILLIALLWGWGYYTIMLRRKLEATELSLSNEQQLRQYYIHKSKYSLLKITYDSLKTKIDSFTPDTIFINQIKIKHDTVKIRILDSSYVYQLEWYKSELDRLYPSK